MQTRMHIKCYKLLMNKQDLAKAFIIGHRLTTRELFEILSSHLFILEKIIKPENVKFISNVHRQIQRRYSGGTVVTPVMFNYGVNLYWKLVAVLTRNGNTKYEHWQFDIIPCQTY